MHPILFKTSFFTVYSYGLCVAVAMALAIVLSQARSVRYGVPPGRALDLLFVVFILGLAGARAFYCLQRWEHFRLDPVSVLYLQQGGLVWYGGFFSAIAGAALYLRVKKLPVLSWADLFAPVAAGAHAVGRIGCFLNGCCYGRKYPVQLLESAGLAAICFWLLSIDPRKGRPGRIFALYMAAYGSLRFALEFLRADQSVYSYLTVPQWTSMALVAAATVFLVKTGEKG